MLKLISIKSMLSKVESNLRNTQQQNEMEVIIV